MIVKALIFLVRAYIFICSFIITAIIGILMSVFWLIGAILFTPFEIYMQHKNKKNEQLSHKTDYSNTNEE